MSNKRIQARNWVFTINNYTPEIENRLKELECEWMIFGHEIGENGTRHLQGAIHFSGKRDAKALGKLFPWHLEVMRGSCQDSKTYCTKEDQTGYFEKGIIPETGSKKGAEATKRKWQECIELAKEEKFEELEEKYPNYYVSHLYKWKQIAADSKKDASMEDVDDKGLKKHFLWLWGPPGTGKSHTARRISRELKCEEPYLKDLNKWWNGYKHQKVTIIEEASPKACEYLGSYFKKWCDKWSFTAECKGTVIPSCRPDIIIVTSNYDIDSCFPEINDSDPIHRRFTEIHLSNRQQHVYWPLTQPEYEQAHTELASGLSPEAMAFSGNSSPKRPCHNHQPDSNQSQHLEKIITEPPSSQEEIDDTQILDFDTEEEETNKEIIID